MTRDRSSCFKEAINEAIPNALHLVDKFHLTKELAEHCEYELKKILENSILFFNPEDKLLVSGKKVRQNKSDLNEFHSIILEKVKNGLSCPCILKFLNEEYGYEGNVTAVQDYVRYLKNNEIQGNLIVIQRKKLVQLFYNKSIEEIFVDETQRACVEKLLSLNKKLSELVSLSTYFHQILYENKSKNELKNLIDINQKIEYQTERLIRFINGIDRDYDYLSNSLAYNFSNGLAEGKINLIKTIKRTMFGRCSFKTLANKIFLFQFMPN